MRAADHAWGWVVDVVVGGLVGALIGAIVAVNIVIYAGPDDGYESSLGAIFDDNVLVGGLTVAVLMSGPVIGVAVVRRLRRRSRSG